ncbi:MAG: penicillin-binding protein activator LpoB [Leptospiraceae bacterium]|nr:penicillin-binding protein activator LpoB [Leptospiraceae bacterium]
MSRILLTLTISLFFFQNCSSGPKRLDESQDIVSDSGGLTRQELEIAADKIGKDIIVHFKKKPDPKGMALAILQTKNDTSEQIPTDVFENALVATMLSGKITTIRTDKRSEQLKEIKLSQQLGTDLSAANLKSPNYFIRTSIDENMFRSEGDKIVEQVLNVELLSIETGIVVFSSKKIYRKQAVSNRGVGW